MRRKMIWPDIPSLAVRLSIIGWNAKFSGPGIPAKIVVEGMILLVGYQNMVDRFGTGGGRWRDRWGPGTRPKCQTDSCQGPKFSQHTPPRLTRIDQLVEIHKFLLPSLSLLQAGYKVCLSENKTYMYPCVAKHKNKGS